MIYHKLRNVGGEATINPTMAASIIIDMITALSV